MRVRIPRPNLDVRTDNGFDHDSVGQELDRIGAVLDDLEQRLAAFASRSFGPDWVGERGGSEAGGPDAKRLEIGNGQRFLIAL